MSSPSVHPATQADLDRLAAMWAAMASLHVERDESFRLVPDAAARVRAFLAAELERPDARVLVAERAGRLCGFANAQIQERPPVFNPPRVGHLDNLYVEPGFRRGGVATALVEECRAWLRCRGITRWSARVHAWNHAALALCARHGLEVEVHELAGSV